MWWDWVKTSRELEVMTWVEFHELFMGKYFSTTSRHAKAQEFLELKLLEFSDKKTQRK